jgi:hypothetical protein
MSKNYFKRIKPIRRSQLISPWGVGAIVPFPEDESLMIAGLDMWQFGNDKSSFIIKDERLEKRLGVKELRLPPDFRDPKTDKVNPYITIPTVRFPRWNYCPFCGTMSFSSYYSKQEVCDGYTWEHGRSCAGKKIKRKLIPERFIVVCPDGHVDEFPIMEWVHKDKPILPSCRLRRSTGGTSASLTGVYYECSCGAKRSMAGVTKDGALKNIYRCKGSKPWLGIDEDKDHPCEKEVKVVQRGGTNVWFADVRSSIHIPADDIDTDRRVIRIAHEKFDKINSRRINGVIDKDFIEMIADDKHVDPEALYKAIICIIDGVDPENNINENMSEEDYRISEYNVLVKSSGGDKLDFHSKNYPISMYNEVIHKFFKSISLVPKLRETRAFVGFSRLQPSDSIDIKDKKKMLRSGEGDWLPAIAVYGEGIFFEFDEEYLGKWANQNCVLNRVLLLDKPFNLMQKRRNPENETEDKLNAKYVLIHTFAHLMINQLSYECGYGSSSIRERIYCDRVGNDHHMYGVLLYTASGDSEGSLGGLVRQGQSGRIEDTIVAAIKNAEWCSADPICIESPSQGPDSCNLAACHNCALLPETCCENGNRLLDRGFVVGTLTDQNLKYFNLKDY